MKKTSYISCANNRVPNSADWGANNLICYGACNSIAIYDPDYCKIGKVTKTLNKHKDRVNVVKWLRKENGESETELLSASTDGTAIIWSLDDETYIPESINEGNPLIIADAIYLGEKNREILLCTGSTEGTFVIWQRISDRSILKSEVLSFGIQIATEARLTFLPRSEVPLLAVALDDCSIRLYCREVSSEDTFKFLHCQTVCNHEDWIRCMDFTVDDNGDCHLATGSQDASIRLWKIYKDEENDEKIKSNETKRRIKKFSVRNDDYAITLESILSSHEHWIYGVNWHPPIFDNGKKVARVPALLSCAMDKSMIIWQPDVQDGIWRESVRVGEVGGNSLGFYGCKYAPDGSGIMAHGYQGSFHLWKYDREEKIWIPRTCPTGHFSGVVDLCWDPKGRFLISASADQTTRVHAPWKTESGEIWHEISRPQVHGYDLSCLAMLGSYTFASGAEEKVVRVFTAPTNFKKYLSTVASTEDWEGKLTEEASVPALGLTNKSIFDEENLENEDRDLDLSRPPNEEELIRHTLWPETQKLYGHGYEIFSMASRRDQKRFATACKSAVAEHAAILIWCTETWSQIQKLNSHRLTVTQMAFSPNDDYLLSVSRDRRFVLHQRNENDDYTIVGASSRTNPFHNRIIWCCAWTHDSKFFTTGSRDGKIGVWNTKPEVEENERLMANFEFHDCSVTALAFAPFYFSDESFVVAIGFDNGNIEVKKIVFQNENVQWKHYISLNSSDAHHSTVKKLAFRPNDFSTNNNILQLASCGMDNAVKIYDFLIDEINAL